jgi:uridine kinase
MAKAAKQSLIVTVSKDRNIEAIVRDLKAAGLDVEGVLDAIGIVTGRAYEKSISRLRKVRGVVDVSPDYKVDIGPPDAPISW